MVRGGRRRTGTGSRARSPLDCRLSRTVRTVLVPPVPVYMSKIEGQTASAGPHARTCGAVARVVRSARLVAELHAERTNLPRVFFFPKFERSSRTFVRFRSSRLPQPARSVQFRGSGWAPPAAFVRVRSSRNPRELEGLDGIVDEWMRIARNVARVYSVRRGFTALIKALPKKPNFLLCERDRSRDGRKKKERTS